MFKTLLRAVPQETPEAALEGLIRKILNCVTFFLTFFTPLTVGIPLMAGMTIWNISADAAENKTKKASVIQYRTLTSYMAAMNTLSSILDRIGKTTLPTSSAELEAFKNSVYAGCSALSQIGVKVGQDGSIVTSDLEIPRMVDITTVGYSENSLATIATQAKRLAGLEQKFKAFNMDAQEKQVEKLKGKQRACADEALTILDNITHAVFTQGGRVAHLVIATTDNIKQFYASKDGTKAKDVTPPAPEPKQPAAPKK